jgi:hypothetical protein
VKPIRLIVNGWELHERFSALVLDELGHLEPASALPPIRKGYCRFQASDNSTHDVPRKHLAAARRIDPNLALVRERAIRNSQGSGHFTITVAARRGARTKIRWSEGDVLQTLYFLAFM